MALHYSLTRVLQYGHPPLSVIRRPLDTGSAVLSIGQQYPVDWADKRQVMRARQYVDQRRIAPDPAWLVQRIPGAAKRIGIDAPKIAAVEDQVVSDLLPAPDRKEKKKNGTAKV